MQFYGHGLCIHPSEPILTSSPICGPSYESETNRKKKITAKKENTDFCACQILSHWQGKKIKNSLTYYLHDLTAATSSPTSTTRRPALTPWPTLTSSRTHHSFLVPSYLLQSNKNIQKRLCVDSNLTVPSDFFSLRVF